MMKPQDETQEPFAKALEHFQNLSQNVENALGGTWQTVQNIFESTAIVVADYLDNKCNGAVAANEIRRAVTQLDDLVTRAHISTPEFGVFPANIRELNKLADKIEKHGRRAEHNVIEPDHYGPDIAFGI